MDEFLGKTIGKYTIERVLGEGGMGSVYMARHKVLEHEVAIKVLRSEFTDRPKLLQRFFLEAKTVAKLRDPGVAQLHDYGHTEDGLAYIVMEWLEGETLAVRLRRHRSLDPIMALRVARGVARTLATVHEQGVIHRDLKPENIFLVSTGSLGGAEQTKILDFGIAKLSSLNRGDVALTQASDVLGTPLYMAPEQWHGAHQVDTRADIYALGCILYRMLVGRPPFKGRTMAELCKGHLTETPPQLKDVDPNVSDDVNALVMSCLDKDKDARPATMRVFAKELARVLKLQVESTLKVDPGALAGILAALDLEASVDTGIPSSRGRGQTERMELPAVSDSMLEGGADKTAVDKPTAKKSASEAAVASKTVQSAVDKLKAAKPKRKRKPSIGTAAFGIKPSKLKSKGVAAKKARGKALLGKKSPLAKSKLATKSKLAAKPKSAASAKAKPAGTAAELAVAPTLDASASGLHAAAKPVLDASASGPHAAAKPVLDASASGPHAAAKPVLAAELSATEPSAAAESSLKSAAAALDGALVDAVASRSRVDSVDLQGWDIDVDEAPVGDEESVDDIRATTRLPATDSIPLAELDETLKKPVAVMGDTQELAATSDDPISGEPSSQPSPPGLVVGDTAELPADDYAAALSESQDEQAPAPGQRSPFGQTTRMSVDELAGALDDDEPEPIDGFDPTTTTAAGSNELPVVRHPRSSNTGYAVAAMAALLLGGLLALVWGGSEGAATGLSVVMSGPAQAIVDIEPASIAGAAPASSGQPAAEPQTAGETEDQTDEEADAKPKGKNYRLKRALYRKALGNTATERELKLLEKICNEEADRSCAGFARQRRQQNALKRVPPHRRNEPVDIY